MKELPKRIEEFEAECLESIQEYWMNQIEWHEFDSFTNGKNSKFSVIERLFVMAFETSKLTESHEECVRLRFEPEIICKSGKKYYPDFCFCFVINHGIKYGHLNLLIELDGHIWHEKTPEKVEQDKIRERELISNGYTVLRFSGREVYRDPFKIVSECVCEYFKRVEKTYQAERNLNG